MVAPAVAAAGIQAVGSIAGSFFGGKQKRFSVSDYGKRMIGAGRWANRKNGVLKGSGQIDIDNYLYDRQFGQTLESAKKHGIHPLVAMGSGGATHSQPFSGSEQAPQTNENWAESVGNGISRVTEAYMTERQRLQNQLLKSQINGSEIENAKSASDLAIRTTGAPPAMMESLPSQSISASKDSQGVEAAHSPMFKKFKMHKGHLYGLSEHAQEAVEGFGHLGGTALGLAALTGTAPLYMKDAAHGLSKTKWYKYTPGYQIAKARKKWKNSRK